MIAQMLKVWKPSRCQAFNTTIERKTLAHTTSNNRDHVISQMGYECYSLYVW